MMRPLILIGGGGHCKSVIEVCRQLNRPVKGILDLPRKAGTEVSGIPVIGTDDDIRNYTDTCDFIITVGFIANPSTRISLYDRTLKAGGKLATIIAPSATVASDAMIGQGTVILSGACVNAGTKIGNNVIINTLSAIEHDVCVGSHSHISTGAMVNGDCHIGSATFIGSNATIINGVEIGNNIVVGAGSTVINNLIQPGVYVGAPAHIVNR